MIIRYCLSHRTGSILIKQLELSSTKLSVDTWLYSAYNYYAKLIIWRVTEAVTTGRS